MGELIRITDGYGNALSIMDTFICRQLEEYKTDLKFYMQGVFSEPYPVISQTVTSLNITSYASNRCFIYVSNGSAFLHCSNYADNNQTTCLLSGTTLNRDQTTGSFTNATDFPFGIDPSTTNFEASISTNIPIFLSNTTPNAIINEYMNNSTTLERINEILEEYALNYYAETSLVDESTNEYYIYNRYQQVSVTRGIISTEDVDIYHWANERILYNGTDICLYRYDSSNPFKLKIKYGNGLVGSIYSESTSEVEDADLSQFTLDTLEYDSPFYSGYNIKLTDSQGTIIETPDYEGYLGTLRTNIPILNSEQDANDYLVGNLDITESYNWDRISQDPVNKELAANTTGIADEQTEFGSVYTRQFFSQMYLCDVSAVQAISNALFDYDVPTLSGLWADIKKGIEMYGTNPMEVVQGLRYYPFDVSQMFTDVQSQNYIYFGAYKLDITSTVYKIIYANGYKDLGTVKIKRTYNDWRDFEPYTKLSIYLPYVGRYQLNTSKYYGKNVNVRYYIDIRTGACVACLIADGILLDWFDGIIGTEMPITLTDYSSYAQSQLNIIMRNAGLGIGGETATMAAGYNVLKGQAAKDTLDNAVAEREAGNLASLASQSKGAGIASGVGAAVAGGAVIAGVAAITIMKTEYDLLRNGVSGYTKSRPGSSAMINQFLPQYPTFMFEIQEIDESPYLNELYGRPTNASGRIGDFSGYLEADDVMLICPIATDNERQEIIDLVRSGIYI